MVSSTNQWIGVIVAESRSWIRIKKNIGAGAESLKSPALILGGFEECLDSPVRKIEVN